MRIKAHVKWSCDNRNNDYSVTRQESIDAPSSYELNENPVGPTCSPFP